MGKAIPVRVEPGGRNMIEFTLEGYAAEPETPRERFGRWGERLFHPGILLLMLALAILLSLPAFLLYPDKKRFDAELLLALTPAYLCAFYMFTGILVNYLTPIFVLGLALFTWPLLIFPPYRRLLFGKNAGPVEQRRGYVHGGHIAQTSERRDGRRTTVTVRFGNGAQAAYSARGADGTSLATEFARLTGPRHTRTALGPRRTG